MARHRGTGRHYPGRHRYGFPGLVHCIYHPAVQLRLAWRRAGWLPTRHDLSGAARRVPVTAPAPAVTTAASAAVGRREWSTGSDRLAA